MGASATIIDVKNEIWFEIPGIFENHKRQESVFL